MGLADDAMLHIRITQKYCLKRSLLSVTDLQFQFSPLKNNFNVCGIIKLLILYLKYSFMQIKDLRSLV